MRLEVANDLSDSAFDFSRVVWPAISRVVDGGEIIPVEAVAHRGFDKELDTLSGIDAWQLMHHRHAIRGIASRVQWGKCWQTFTIRMARPSGVDTEYQKRLQALDNLDRGFLLPHLTIQGYVEKPKRFGQFVGGAVIKTSDLFALARDVVECGAHANLQEKFWGYRTTYSCETLLWLHWDLFSRIGIDIKRVLNRARAAA